MKMWRETIIATVAYVNILVLVAANADDKALCMSCLQGSLLDCVVENSMTLKRSINCDNYSLTTNCIVNIYNKIDTDEIDMICKLTENATFASKTSVDEIISVENGHVFQEQLATENDNEVSIETKSVQHVAENNEMDEQLKGIATEKSVENIDTKSINVNIDADVGGNTEQNMVVKHNDEHFINITSPTAVTEEKSIANDDEIHILPIDNQMPIAVNITDNAKEIYEVNKLETNIMTNEKPTMDNEINHGYQTDQPPSEIHNNVKVGNKTEKSFSCFECNSHADIECGRAANKTAICKIIDDHKSGCFTFYKKDNNETTRGCIEQLAQEGIKVCKTDKKVCQLCYEANCNDLPSKTCIIHGANISTLLMLTLVLCIKQKLDKTI